MGIRQTVMPNEDSTITSAVSAPLIKRTFKYALATTQQNIQEVWTGTTSFLSAYLNEWGALRGANPYASFSDSLVRGFTPAGGPKFSGAAGNMIEVQDRRITAGSGQNLWGRRWSDGALMRNDGLVKETYEWRTGDPDPTSGGTIALPAGARWIFNIGTADTLPSWAPTGSRVLRS